MAKFNTDGIEDFGKKFKSIAAEMRGRAMTTIMKAGGDVLAEEWQDKIKKHNHISKGTGQHMIDAVEMTKPFPTETGFEAAVYPQGQAGHRITHAQKAYILHHGRYPTQRGTKAIKGSGFVKEAEKTAKPKVIEAMQNALNEIVGKE